MKKIIYVLGVLILTASCNEDSLTDLNKDEKNPSVVPAYTLFTNAEKTTADQVTSTNVNRNIFRLINQQWTETTYLDESNYEWTTRKISDNHWNAIYAGPLADLNQAKKYLNESVIVANDPDFATKTTTKQNQLALIDILSVYNFQILVDTFGDVPYTEALQGDVDYLPAYTPAKEIYLDLVKRLDNDLAKIDVSGQAFGAGDVIYTDDLTKWVKFANSIKLKLGVNLKSAGEAIADATITSAVAGGVINSNADNAKLPYMLDLPNTNPLYVDMVFSGRHDFVPAKPFVDALNSLSDPRRAAYFAKNKTPYVGGVVGVKNTYGSFTHVSDPIQAPDFSATLLDYAEVEFLLAEASARGVVGLGSIDTHYTNAITASMEDWGVQSADIATYLAKPQVAYATATGTWQEKIGNQAWYAMFNRGFEGWTFTRRLNFPVLLPPATAAPAANGKIPVRMTYPIREQTLNPTNYKAASTSIGGDFLYTPLFWDK